MSRFVEIDSSGSNYNREKNSVSTYFKYCIFIFNSVFRFVSTGVYASGIYNGTIKVGCYVWDSSDCQKMLGRPVEKGSFSKYSKTNTAEFTPEYLAAFESLKEKPNQTTIAFSSIPGAYFLISPFTAFHFDEVKQKLRAQKIELEKYKIKAS